MDLKYKMEKIVDLLGSAVFLAIIVLFIIILLSLTVGFFGFFHYFDAPEANIGKYYYESTEDYTPNGLPINLINFNVEVLDFYYRKASGVHYPFLSHYSYIDSLADDIKNPTQIITLNYDIWESSISFLLDRKEKSLQKKYKGEIEEANFDYGSKKAYWIKDNLILRYESQIVCFNGNSPKNIIDNEICASYMRENFS